MITLCENMKLQTANWCLRNNYRQHSNQMELVEQVDIKIYESVNEVPEQVWTTIINPSNLLTQASYLQMIEKLHSDQLRFYYSVCYLDKEIVGFFFFQENIFRGTNLLDYFPSEENANWLKRIGIKFISLFKPIIRKIEVPMLNAGNIFMTGEAGCFCIYQQNKVARYALQLRCIESIIQQYPHIKAILNADFYEDDIEDSEIFRNEKYRYISIEGDNIMRIPSEWKTFEDYILALSSKYRVRAKNIIKKSTAVSKMNLSLEDTKKYANEINALYQHVASKVSFKLATLHQDFFIYQKENMPDNYYIEGYFHNDTMIGFVSYYVFDDSIEVHYFGIDYAILKELHLYQRMLYDMVATAIHFQKRKIHFGRTAPEVKTTIGAELKPMFGYLKYRNPVVNFIMQFFTRNLQPRQYTLRSPFKEA